MLLKKHIKQNFIIKRLRFWYRKLKLITAYNKLIKESMEWRDINRHNFTNIGNGISDCKFPMDIVKVGIGTYGTLNVASYGIGNEGLTIGSYCSIAPEVQFVLGGEHSVERFSTYPFERIFIDSNSEELFFSKGKIVVENDVWIGSNVLILSGVTLKQGTVVAAGSVITKSTEPYSIVGGNPAKLIKKRFSDEIISKLLAINFSSLDNNFIQSNIAILKKKLDNDVIDEIERKLIESK